MVSATKMVRLLAVFALFMPSVASAGEPKEPLHEAWLAGVGFGEIPFLAGSFKPSFTLGFHLNEYLFIGGVFQLSDTISRGNDSFNASRTDLGGLTSSREKTGPRAFVGARIRPHRFSPYLSIGGIFNGSDTELMRFDARRRSLGGEVYEGALELELTRPFGLRPAFGLGYSITFDSGLSVNLDFTGAWLFDQPEPEIRIGSSQGSLGSELERAIRARLVEAYEGNFHNRYHLFNISVGWVW